MLLVVDLNHSSEVEICTLLLLIWANLLKVSHQSIINVRVKNSLLNVLILVSLLKIHIDLIIYSIFCQLLFINLVLILELLLLRVDIQPLLKIVILNQFIQFLHKQIRLKRACVLLLHLKHVVLWFLIKIYIFFLCLKLRVKNLVLQLIFQLFVLLLKLGLLQIVIIFKAYKVRFDFIRWYQFLNILNG